ncbi:alpha/beta hydrolase [Gramella jeungdoensis]|uniref:Alpha/beta hydrolase n=1 Tax=Gramella jeungdoensis TaxID=708091 RepID=A0ABT0Z538_9FLAO|nr:alpha/beta fold hydrolase [Gramella jeungdoensis]MCM8569894.1 alpha/beta hydrolase [Gramella jeungdoensis]
MKKSFLFIPGAWMGKWIWKDLKESLEDLNYTVYTVSLRGLESKNAQKNFDLQDHVDDVKTFIEEKNLNELIVVGHSYSGFVIGQLADQVPEKISKLIFLEAFFPLHDQNLFEAAGLNAKEEIQIMENNSGNWPPPTLDELKQQKHLSGEQIRLLNKKLVDHPGKSVSRNAYIKSDKIEVESVFIGSNFNMSVRQKLLYGNVGFYELNGGHWPMLTKRKKLTGILDKIASN